MSVPEEFQFTPPVTPQRKTPPRSGAVTAVAIVNFIVGGLSMFCGLLIGVLGGTAGAMLGAGMENARRTSGGMEMPGGSPSGLGVGTVLGGIAVVMGIITFLLGVPTVIAGIGVLKRQQWGRILTLILGGLSAAFGLFALSNGNVVQLLINAAYATLVFVILLNREYAAEFR